MNVRSKENGAIDIAKYVMAILVIIIHRPLFGDDRVFQNYMVAEVICAIAVPFFFIVSAYYFFLKTDRKENNFNLFLTYEKRLCILYILWSIIFIPCSFVKNHTGHYDELSIKLVLGQCYLWVKNTLFSYSFIHLWYLNTLIVSIAILYFLYKKLDYKRTVVICMAIFLLFRTLSFLNEKNMFVGTVYNYIPQIFRNTFEKGLLCTSFGLLLSKCEIKLNRLTNVVLFVVFYSAAIFCGFKLFNNSASILQICKYLFTALAALNISSFCIKTNLKPSPIYYYLRKSSTVLYFSHLLLLSEMFQTLSRNLDTSLFENNPFLFVFTFVFAQSLAILLIKLNKTKKFKLIKYLF